MTHSFQVGDIVRKKSNDWEFELEDINDNPNWVEDDEYWATGNMDGGYGNVEVDHPDEIELVMSAKKAAARTLPSAADIVAGLDLMGSGFDGAVDVHTSEKDGDSVWCYGRATNGLDVTFKVTVSEVFQGGDY